MSNYFNKLSLSEKINQLGKCRFMSQLEFGNGVEALKSKDNKCKKSGILMISGRIDEVDNYGNLLFFEKPFNIRKIVSFAKYLLKK